MRRARSRGLTMAELMVAMFILFVAGMFMLGSLITASSNSRRVQERSSAVILAQGTVERLAVQPSAAITPGTYSYTGDYATWLYDVGVAPFPGSSLQLLTVTVHSPVGAQVSDELILGRRLIAGIACGWSDGNPLVHAAAEVGWLNPPGAFAIDGNTNTQFPLAALPCGCPPGLATDDKSQDLWASDPTTPAIQKMGSLPNGTWVPIALPPGFQSPAGMTWNPNDGSIWVVDRGAGALWSLSKTGAWSGPYAPAGGFNDAVGVAFNHARSVAYVLDAGAGCVVPFTLGANTWGAPLTPAGGFASAAAIATVEPEDPVGTSDQIVVVDNSNLNVYDTSTAAWQTPIPLDPALSAAGPCGIGFSDAKSGIPSGDDNVWVVAPGTLWHYQWDAGGWTKVL